MLILYTFVCVSSHLRRHLEASDAYQQEPPDRYDPAVLPHRRHTTAWSVNYPLLLLIIRIFQLVNTT